MLETYFVSFGVAVRPIWVAPEKYSRISRQAESSAALPRWHSSMTIRSKKSGRELPEQLLALLRPGDGLVQARDRSRRTCRCGASCRCAVGSSTSVPSSRSMVFDAGAELRHRRAERPEVVDHRLVDEHVAVGEEQDALLAPGLPQPPDDLERRVGLAGAGRHDQQDAVLALGDGLDRGVDRRCAGSSAAPCRCRRRSSPAGRSASASGVRPFHARYLAHSVAGRRELVEREGRFDLARCRRCGRERRSRRRWRRTRTGCCSVSA